MSVACHNCGALTRGTALHDADGERVFAYCDVCGFATVEHIFNSSRESGALAWLMRSMAGKLGV